jgi:hypothetical protein
MLAALALALGAVGLTAPGAHASAGLATGGPAASSRGPATGVPRLHFGVRLVDVPVDESANPRALQYIIDFLPAGSVIRRRIMIINDEPQAAHFSVYPAAAQISGGRFLGQAGQARNELTGWITVQRPSVTLGPGQSTMDLVTIRVPPGATRMEHYGIIWAQQAATIRASSTIAIKDVARVGVRVYLAVGRGGVPLTRFTITSLAGRRSPSGQALLVAGVHDTGGRAIDLTGQVRLAGGPGGSSAGPFTERQAVTLAPGQSGSVRFTLPAGLPDGPWTASVTLASGLTTATARATVLFGAQATDTAWTRPAILAWGGGLAAGLLVVAAAAIARLRRPRHMPA